MKTISTIVLAAFFSTAVSFACDAHQTHASPKDLNEVMKKTGQELDLERVLSDLKISPAAGTSKEANLWKVESVKKGSIFSKAGLKAGDIVSMKDEPKMISQEQATEDDLESELE